MLVAGSGNARTSSNYVKSVNDSMLDSLEILQFAYRSLWELSFVLTNISISSVCFNRNKKEERKSLSRLDGSYRSKYSTIHHTEYSRIGGRQEKKQIADHSRRKN